MANEAIRARAKEKGVKLWQVADRIGLTDSNFSRKLRKELPAAEGNMIIGIIDDIAKEEQNGSN